MDLAESKKLKPGDKLIYIGEFAYIDEDETIATKGREGHHYFWPEEVSLAPSDPENGIKNTETTPKYDPYRLFRKGDRVTPKEVNGRHPGNRGVIFRVCQDEEVSGCEIKLTMDGHIGHITINAAYLELVVPVEELEPYMVKELKDSFIVYHDCTKIVLNDTSLLAKFMKASHPNAKAAAEAECDRLNAEYRKEQE